MVAQEPVEEHRVALLKLAKEDVTGEVAVRCVVLGAYSLELCGEILDDRWQQAVKTEAIALVGTERGALVAISVGE